MADSVTGKNWNRYIFRTGRNSSQDAIASATAISTPGVVIATIAQDYAFGRDGVTAYKKAVSIRGAKVIYEEYLPFNTTNFVPTVDRIIDVMKNQSGEKYIYIVWAGQGNPYKIANMDLKDKYNIKVNTTGNIFDLLRVYKSLNGMIGAVYYYYEFPKNKINDWFVKEHMRRYRYPPDFFTCGGFAAAVAVVTALEKAGSTDTERLISAMEGMHFMTPKGEMVFRPEDHQALQSMFVFKLQTDPYVRWAVPELIGELTWKDMNIPIYNK